MPDITMCSDDECHMAKMCYRHEATPTPQIQSYFLESPRIGKSCDHFWKIDPEKKES